MAAVRWLPGALDDLKRLHAILEPLSADAAHRAVSTIIEAAEQPGEFPGQGKPWEPDMRFREWSVRFGAKGYVIRCGTEGDEVVIVRVWHGLEDRDGA